METKRIVKRISFFIVLSSIIIFSISKTFAQEDRYKVLVGTWDMVLMVEGQEMPASELVFEMKKGKITGYWVNEEQSAEITDIKIEKGVFSFKLEVDAGGEAAEIIGEATIKDNKMEGTAESPVLGSMTFTGEKRKN